MAASTLQPASPDKFILTHRGALLAKYQATGLKKVEAALERLVKADARRGIASQILRLDVAADMKPFGSAVPALASARDIKRAIDAIAQRAQAHYLMILGGPDVVPLVPLTNPAFSGPQGDPDKIVPSDLPYACDGPYSTQISRFMGPTRVLGRLPDLPGAQDPALLLSLLAHATQASTRPRSDYDTGFGITAQAWEKSTELSLRNLLGRADSLHRVPAEGPRWSKVQLAARLHFINCHGAEDSPEYYGQPAGVEDYPVAHRAKLVRGKVSTGTVLAAECCYGAQLYDPKLADGQQGIALTYLEDGATAVFGSTTIAYGPSEGNGTADLICQYFVAQVLSGASCGRAALEARQKFAGGRTHMDPYDLKTLAQFYLLGDPSAHPVAVQAHALSRTKAFKKAFAPTGDRTVRALRREKLSRDGAALARDLPQLRSSDAAPSPAVQQALSALMKETGLPKAAERLSFQLKGSKAAPLSGERRIHVVKGLRATSSNGGVPLVALVATEQDGQLLHVRRLHAR